MMAEEFFNKVFLHYYTHCVQYWCNAPVLYLNMKMSLQARGFKESSSSFNAVTTFFTERGRQSTLLSSMCNYPAHYFCCTSSFWPVHWGQKHKRNQYVSALASFCTGPCLPLSHGQPLKVFICTCSWCESSTSTSGDICSN